MDTGQRFAVVALAVRETDEDVVSWAEAGVSGIVSRNASIGQLLDAIAAAVEIIRLAGHGLRALEVQFDGRESVLYELRPHRISLGEISSDTLVRAIRAVPKWDVSAGSGSTARACGAGAPRLPAHEPRGLVGEAVPRPLRPVTEVGAKRRRDLLVRYLGLPLWDVLLFPIQALADAGENDGVKIRRMSPFEATVLSTTPGDKVEG